MIRCTECVGLAISAIPANPHRDGRIRTSDFLLPKHLRSKCPGQRSPSDSRREQRFRNASSPGLLSADARLCGQRVRPRWDSTISVGCCGAPSGSGCRVSSLHLPGFRTVTRACRWACREHRSLLSLCTSATVTAPVAAPSFDKRGRHSSPDHHRGSGPADRRPSRTLRNSQPSATLPTRPHLETGLRPALAHRSLHRPLRINRRGAPVERPERRPMADLSGCAPAVQPGSARDGLAVLRPGRLHDLPRRHGLVRLVDASAVRRLTELTLLYAGPLCHPAGNRFEQIQFANPRSGR